MKGWSLRSRLTLQVGLVLVVAVSVSVAGVDAFSWHEQVENLDAGLRRESAAVSKILSSDLPRQDAERVVKSLLAVESGRRLVQVKDRDELRMISNHLHPEQMPDLTQAWTGGATCRSMEIDGHSMRVGIFPETIGLVAVAADLNSINETVQEVIPWYFVFAVVLVLVIVQGGAWLAGRALQPIGELADATGHITSLETNQRLPAGQADEEINRLSRLLNRMLDRLQANFGLVRRFTADAAHEIKTPLTIIHGQLEGALRTLDFSHQQEDALISTLREVRRLNRLVDGLLLLSRSDAGHLELQIQPLDGSALLDELLHDAEILCAPLNLQLEAEIAPGLRVSADAGHLRQVLLNLLDNACKYNRPSGRIRLVLAAAENGVRLEIGNTGPAISTQAVPYLFERFQRGDDARGRERDGLGLGLSICQEIIRAHGGEIELVESRADWTVFAVRLFERTA